MQLRCSPLDLPLARPFRIARGVRTVASNVLVEIEDEGTVGRGEAAPNVRYDQSQETALAALQTFSVEGFAPFDQAAILDRFERHAPRELAARCALESALWDWAGQRLGRPLHVMLAIDPGHSPHSSWTISIDDPSGIADRVREAHAWPELKVKLGGGDEDERTIESLRAATDRPFRVDVNEAWQLEEAREKTAWLADRGCTLVEQPLPAADHDATVELRSSSPLPLVADEAMAAGTDLDRLAEAYDGINVKLMKTGGIRAAVRLVHAARSRGLRVMLGCFVESTLGITAASHLAPLAEWADLDGAALLAEDPFVGTEVTDGHIRLATGPGLGVSPR